MSVVSGPAMTVATPALTAPQGTVDNGGYYQQYEEVIGL